MEWQMRKLLVVLGTIAGLLVLVVAAGFLLPRDHRVASRVVLRAPVDSVWRVVRNLKDVPDFWDDVRTVRREDGPTGDDVWVQAMADGSELRLMIWEDNPPHRFVAEIVAGEGAPFGGRWIYDVERAGGGTAVTVTEDGWVANPVFRKVSLAMGHHGTLDSYLSALARRFGDSVAPTHPQ
jgi:hypothetical protein